MFIGQNKLIKAMDNFTSRGHYKRAGMGHREKKNLWPFTIIFAHSYFVGVLILKVSENLAAFEEVEKREMATSLCIKLFI